MKDVIASLQILVEEWLTVAAIPEVDWSRLRGLEFQEILRSRDFVAEKSRKRQQLCPHFFEHVSRCTYLWLRFDHTPVFSCSWTENAAGKHCVPQAGHIRSKPGIDTRLRTTNWCSQRPKIC